jgi:FixJ family two-component response regulator
VYLIDDDTAFLRATARKLRASGYEVSASESASDFLAEVEIEAPGCVVTDLVMPELDGITLQERLEELGCTLPVVFLTGNGDIPTTVRAMRLGAEDFLTKTSPREALLAAIDRALDRNCGERAARARQRGLRQRFDSLSARELEVLSHVVRGQLNKQIAADLGIHERTVKLHRTSITSKLGVRSAAELATLAREAGIFGEDHAPTFPKGQ